MFMTSLVHFMKSTKNWVQDLTNTVIKRDCKFNLMSHRSLTRKNYLFIQNIMGNR